MPVPKPPPGLGAEARRLWREILAEYELAEHELAILRQACRTLDTCEQLQRTVDEEGMASVNRLGEAKPHWALVELRQQRILLNRQLVCLRVPLGETEDETGGRPQYRGARGVYVVGAG